VNVPFAQVQAFNELFNQQHEQIPTSGKRGNRSPSDTFMMGQGVNQYSSYQFQQQQPYMGQSPQGFFGGYPNQPGV